MLKYGIDVSKSAQLRVCASCEWIWKGLTACPKCEFVSYGAKSVYGMKAYRHAKTQQPWKDKKMFEYEQKLLKEIKNGNSNRPTVSKRLHDGSIDEIFGIRSTKSNGRSNST